LSAEGRIDLERRYNADIDKLERDIAQLNSLRGKYERS
jgi:hypothetical protein